MQSLYSFTSQSFAIHISKATNGQIHSQQRQKKCHCVAEKSVESNRCNLPPVFPLLLVDKDTFFCSCYLSEHPLGDTRFQKLPVKSSCGLTKAGPRPLLHAFYSPRWCRQTHPKYLVLPPKIKITQIWRQ